MIDDNSGITEVAPFIGSLDDSRIKLIQNQTNFGVSKNFQFAIENSHEKLMTIMGCDDVLMPEYVDQCLRIHARFPEASYIQPGVVVIDEHGRTTAGITDVVKYLLKKRATRITPILSGERLAKSLATGCWTYFPSLCWRTDVVKKFGFDTDFSIVLDMDLQMRIIAEGGSLVVDDYPAFQYRRHRASASMSAAANGKRFDEESRLYRELTSRFLEIGWNKAARAAKLHLTSRLNAFLHLGLCLVNLKFQFVPTLFRYTFK